MSAFRKLTAAVLALAVLLTALPVLAESGGSDVLYKTVPMYLLNSTRVDEIEVVFFDGESQIPYLSLNSAINVLCRVWSLFGDGNYTITSGFSTLGELRDLGKVSITDDTDDTIEVFYMERENGSLALFDSEDDWVFISDRDKFLVGSFAVSGGDLVASDGLYYEYNEDETTSVRMSADGTSPVMNLYKRLNSRTFKREGDSLRVELSDYGIDLKMDGGEMYAPVATISDLILPVVLTWNGEALFMTNGDLNTTVQNDDGLTMYDLYYRPGASERSQALAEFTYGELCMMLDNSYGLQSEHRISGDFAQYFEETGLVDMLASTDSDQFTEGLYELVRGYFADHHSWISAVTPYSGGEFSIDRNNISTSTREFDATYDRFNAAREAAGITPGYAEIGDTAFITFDSFDGAKLDYYDQSLYENFRDIYTTDTISLIVYSHAMIHRADSPIRKVVIDLSLNGGGALDACVYVAAWVLGTAVVNIENVFSGAQYTTQYWVDVNLDGQSTLEDELGANDLDVYCLISGYTFSCGNLLTAMFKEDGRVTLVGQASGGGSCIVRNTAAADGTLFSTSDFYRMSLVKNGSFYSIDEGVEPDIPLRKAASYYDREGLMEYLSNFR